MNKNPLNYCFLLTMAFTLIDVNDAFAATNDIELIKIERIIEVNQDNTNLVQNQTIDIEYVGDKAQVTFNFDGEIIELLLPPETLHNKEKLAEAISGFSEEQQNTILKAFDDLQPHFISDDEQQPTSDVDRIIILISQGKFSAEELTKIENALINKKH